ncbi:hypothetical protein FQA39_LY05163 [Lamprigera yunnana]|nr:hypothetical protein FQA39_LY05163 [Lamprigera yunnana]
MENNYSRWTRPDNVHYPHVWSRFQGLKKVNGIVPSFWIQDIPLDQYEVVVDLTMNGFSLDEPLNIINDQESLDSLRSIMSKALLTKCGLVCYAQNLEPNGKPIIAAVSCTTVKTKWDKEVKVSMKFFKSALTNELNLLYNNGTETRAEGKTLTRIYDTMDVLRKRKNVFDALQVDVLMCSNGLYTSPDYRGQGLGIEMFKARETLSKAFGIKASVSTATSIISQKLAERAGYKVLSEISYDELKNMDSKFSYPGIEKHSSHLKVLYKFF